MKSPPNSTAKRFLSRPGLPHLPLTFPPHSPRSRMDPFLLPPKKEGEKGKKKTNPKPDRAPDLKHLPALPSLPAAPASPARRILVSSLFFPTPRVRRFPFIPLSSLISPPLFSPPRHTRFRLEFYLANICRLCLCSPGSRSQKPLFAFVIVICVYCCTSFVSAFFVTCKLRVRPHPAPPPPSPFSLRFFFFFFFLFLFPSLPFSSRPEICTE